MNRKQLKIFLNPKPINTQRLTLRKIEITDLLDVYEYAKNPAVSRYLLWYPHPSLEYTREYLKIVGKMYQRRKFYDFAVVVRDTGKMIGTCGFTRINLSENTAEIGYVLNEDYWGAGYAREAVAAIIDLAREVLELDGLYAEFIEENTKSKSLLIDLGFCEDSEKRHELTVKGEVKSILVYKKNLSCM